MVLSFFVGFWLGMVMEYWLQAHVPKQRHVREAEEAAATAWDNQGA